MRAHSPQHHALPTALGALAGRSQHRWAPRRAPRLLLSRRLLHSSSRPGITGAPAGAAARHKEVIEEGCGLCGGLLARSAASRGRKLAFLRDTRGFAAPEDTSVGTASAEAQATTHNGAAPASETASDAIKEHSSPAPNASNGHASQDAEDDWEPRAPGLAGFLRTPHDKEILSMVVPAMAAVLLDPVMNLVDTALVGRLGAANLAGAGTAGLIFSFSSWLFGFLAMVTTPKVAVARAKGNHEEAYRQVGQTIFLAASIGCCLAAGFWVGAEKLAGTLAHGDPAVLGHATTYLKCRALSAPFLLVQFVAFGSFRGMKDTRTPLLASVLSNITNLLLDCLFIFGFGWGVAGASIASSIAVTVGCTTALTLLCRKGMIKARYVFRIPPWSDVLPTFTAGLSLSLRTISGMAAVLTATSCISWLGAAPLAAHEILRQMWILTIMAYEGFNAAANALIAVGVGQGRPDRAAGVFRRLMELSGIWGLAVGLSLWFARHQIAATFTTDPAVAMVVLAIFPLLTALQPLDAMVGVMDGTMYGLQEHKFIGMSMAVTTAFCLSTLFGLWQVWPSVMAVWVSLKVLTIGRGVAGTWKLTRKDSFLMEAARMRAEEQELNGARGTNGNGGGGPLPAPAATG